MASFPLAVASNDYALHLNQPIASSSQHHPMVVQHPSPPFPGESYLSTFGYRPWWGPHSCLFETGIPPESSSANTLSLDTSSSKASFHRHGVTSLSDMATIESDFPASPSELSSSSSETGPSPAPEFIHAVCNAPLVAPVPLPYHSPTFLQFDDLPDDDEDLSHPPYVSRPQKRKRGVTGVADELEAADLSPPAAVRRRVSIPDNHKTRTSRNHRSAAIHPMYHLHSGGYASRPWQVPMVGVTVGGGMPG